MSTVSSQQQLSTGASRHRGGTGTVGPAMRVPPSGAAGTSSASVSSKSTGGTGGTGGGASLLGLMASKRFAKQFASKVMAKRRGHGSESTANLRNISMEPTYRMEPSTHFQVGKVKDRMQKLVDLRMNGFQYTPKVAAMLSKVLSSEIKDAVKDMGFDRYKIICLVTIGQNGGQDMCISSRCSWDTNVDTSASYTWSDANSYCCAMVYGIYHE